MNLLLFLSDRCNMACDYCFLSLNQGPATVLSPEAARAAIASFRGNRVTILGGEPFVHWPLLKASAEAARARGLAVSVVTNATLLCPEKLSELSALGVEVCVSLDGRAADHDRHRKLVGGGGSAHAESLLALERADKAALRANLVLSADTAGALLANLESLRAAGFRQASFHLDVAGDWPEPALSELSASLSGLRRYLEAARGTLRLSHLDSFREPSSEHGYDDLVLGSDGRYYPCDALFARPYSELDRWACGDAFGGVDEGKRADFQGEALAYIHAALAGKPHYGCPRESYFLALLSGRDPARAVRAYARADALLGAALNSLGGPVAA